jgi:CheY-like chemotaxis protein
VVVLTASKFDDAIAVCKRLGAESFIAKPVDFQNFSAMTLQLSLQWALLKPAPFVGA